MKEITAQIIKDPTEWDEGSDYPDINLMGGEIQIDTVHFRKGDTVPCASFCFNRSQLCLYNEAHEEVEVLDLVLQARFRVRDEQVVS